MALFVLGDHHHISIHALLAESDVVRVTVHTCQDVFLSTLSLRRATVTDLFTGDSVLHFYPRSPCGERRWSVDVPGWILGISIHALLAESDGGPGGQNAVFLYFYPRSPCGERRYPTLFDDLKVPISIHALLAESDHPEPD